MMKWFLLIPATILLVLAWVAALAVAHLACWHVLSLAGVSPVLKALLWSGFMFGVFMPFLLRVQDTWLSPLEGD